MKIICQDTENNSSKHNKQPAKVQNIISQSTNIYKNLDKN